MKKQFLSLLAAGFMLGCASQIKAMEAGLAMAVASIASHIRGAQLQSQEKEEQQGLQIEFITPVGKIAKKFPIKAMNSTSNVNSPKWYTFAFRTENLIDSTSLILYALDHEQFAIWRTSTAVLNDAPIVFNANDEKYKKTLVLLARFKANEITEAIAFRAAAAAANNCMTTGKDIRQGVINSLKSNGAQPLQD